VYKIYEDGWTCWFFKSFYLELPIWPDAISRWIGQGNSIKFCTNLGKSATKTLAMIRQAFWKRAWAVHGKFKFTETEKGEIGKEQSQEFAYHFLWHQGDCSQRIHHDRQKSRFRILLRRFAATAWKCANTSPRTLPTKELAVASRQRTVSHFLFHQGMFYKNNLSVVPTHPTN
jgi:hypothetical protein